MERGFNRLKDRVAIITGGGTGIGKAISLAFANEGAVVVVVAARNLSRLEEVAKDIKSRGGKAKAIQTDISDHEQIKRMVAQTIEEFGQIDVLVNNAGVLRRGPFLEITDDLEEMRCIGWCEVLRLI
jgi:3-oxoacyl-[acyl-carrier protein] reductase